MRIFCHPWSGDFGELFSNCCHTKTQNNCKWLKFSNFLQKKKLPFIWNTWGFIKVQSLDGSPGIFFSILPPIHFQVKVFHGSPLSQRPLPLRIPWSRPPRIVWGLACPWRCVVAGWCCRRGKWRGRSSWGRGWSAVEGAQKSSWTPAPPTSRRASEVRGCGWTRLWNWSN